MSDTKEAPEGTTPEDAEESTSQEEEQEQAASGSDDAQAADDEAGDEEESGPAKGRSAKLQKLLNKYGGDEDKLAEAIYESYNSGSRLRQELDELRAQLEEAKTPKQPEVSADITDLKEQMSVLEAQNTEYQSDKADLVKSHSAVSRDIAKLEGKLEDADDLDKPRLQHLLHIKETEKARLERDWKDVVAKERKLFFEQKDLVKRYKRAEAEFEAERARQSRSKADERRDQQGFLAEFREAIDDAASDLGLKDDESREYFHNVIKAEAIAYLRAQPDAQGIDPEEFVTARAKAFARVHGLGKKQNFTQKSKDKLEAAGTRPNGTVKPAAPGSRPELPKGKLTPQQALEWRTKILGG